MALINTVLWIKSSRSCLSSPSQLFSSIFQILIFLFMSTTIVSCRGGKGDISVATGLQAFESQEYQFAAVEFERAIEQGVSKYKPEEVYTLLGRAYEKDEQYDKAIAAYQKAVEINPQYYKAWVNLGVAYRLSGDIDRAEASYTEALAIEPDYAELHASLGALYIFKNEPHKALDALANAIELDPQLAVAHANMAVAYAMTGQFERAEEALNDAIQLDYDNSIVIRARIESLRARQ